MSRKPREQSECGFYHVMTRGTGRMALFEDEEDRKRYLSILLRCKESAEVKIYAWCLMENHVHIVLHAMLPALSRLMQRVGTAYAWYYNNKYNHTGHVFQSPFKSKAIADETQLLTCIRYVNQNPVKAGIACCCGDYRWSSYRECKGVPGIGDDYICDVTATLTLFDSARLFEEFHGVDEDSRGHLDCDLEQERGDAAARRIANEVLGGDVLHEMLGYPRRRRNDCVLKLRRAGISIRQVERLSGISRGIVQRVCDEEERMDPEAHGGDKGPGHDMAE